MTPQDQRRGTLQCVCMARYTVVDVKAVILLLLHPITHYLVLFNYYSCIAIFSSFTKSRIQGAESFLDFLALVPWSERDKSIVSVSG